MSEVYDAAMEIVGAIQGLYEKLDVLTDTMRTIEDERSAALDDLLEQLKRIATALEAQNAKTD